MHRGYIKLWRKLDESFVWEMKPFSMGQAWVDLLLKVNHKEKDVLFRLRSEHCGQGQLITSTMKLSERWGWDRKKVKRFLNLCQAEDMLKYHAKDKRFIVITILNYTIYQGKNEKEEQQEDNKRTTHGTTHGTTNAPTNAPTNGTTPPQGVTHSNLNPLQLIINGNGADMDNTSDNKTSTFCPEGVQNLPTTKEEKKKEVKKKNIKTRTIGGDPVLAFHQKRIRSLSDEVVDNHPKVADRKASLNHVVKLLSLTDDKVYQYPELEFREKGIENIVKARFHLLRNCQRNYEAYCQINHVGPNYLIQSNNFFGRAERWREFMEEPEQPPIPPRHTYTSDEEAIAAAIQAIEGKKNG